MPTSARTAIKAMPSYLSLASSRLSSFKGKVTQYREEVSLLASTTTTTNGGTGGDGGNTQSWKQWAGQKIRKNLSKNDGKVVGNEEVVLFPGWAARRYIGNVVGAVNAGSKEPFEVDVFVSGYASARRAPEHATRSQRAFLRLAKGFASLPKLVSDTDSVSTPLTRSTEDLLASIQLPPRPNEISDEYETQMLEQQFLKLNAEDEDPDSGPPSANPAVEPDVSPSPVSAPPALISVRSPTGTGDPRKLHANLEARLRPFWSTALSARQIRIQLFVSHSHTLPQEDSTGGDGAIIDVSSRKPIASKDVQTAADGSFSAKLTVSWDEICQHPEGAHIAFGDPGKEHDVYIEVELLPSPTARELLARGAESAVGSISDSIQRVSHLDFSPLKRSVTSTLFTPLTHSPIRVISDIDDTIKFSNILSGARTVFHNVFVKELTETTIPGMGDWYDQMWKSGVRFHYVSNGPYELLPVVKEFLDVSRLPPGSIKLKSYTGRSLFNGLLSAPASRKRIGVVEVLDSFPTSRFFLIGDTGEQDLELYASLAAERPNQIVGVFLRDASDNGVDLGPDGRDTLLGGGGGGERTNTSSSTSSIEDPTGGKVFSGQVPLEGDLLTGKKSPASETAASGSYFTAEPLSAEPETYAAKPTQSTPPVAFSGFRTPSPSRMSSASSRKRTKSSLPESERRRNELQTRVWRARMQIPTHIPLRVFRRPEECVEAWEVLDKVHSGTL